MSAGSNNDPAATPTTSNESPNTRPSLPKRFMILPTTHYGLLLPQIISKL
jgi:hypothetical protein